MHRLHLEKAPCELIMLGGYEEDYESVIDKFSQGDKISLRSGGYEVEVPIGNTYIKSFGEITEKA